MGGAHHNGLRGLHSDHSAFAPVTCDQSFSLTVTPRSFCSSLTYCASISAPAPWPAEVEIDFTSADWGSKGGVSTASDCMTFAAFPSPSSAEANPPCGTENNAWTASALKSALVSLRLRPWIDLTSAPFS